MKLKHYLSYREVLKKEQAQTYLTKKIDAVNYTEPRSKFPIIPFQIFALTYENDIVIETNHPVFTMHEFAQIDLNGNKTWIAKDSIADGTQTLTVPDKSLLMLAPEIDIPRRFTPFDIEDNSTSNTIDLVIKYTNQLNELTEVRFKSNRLCSSDKQKKTNGSTFNHSQKSVSALLDISHKNLKVNASVSYNGVDYGLKKILGVIPIKALLRQTQAGLAAGELTQQLSNNHLQIKRQNEIVENWNYQNNILSYNNKLSEFEYFYNDNHELTGIKVKSKDKELLSLELSAPLPDIQRKFTGEVSRNFIVKVNGLIQGMGVIKAIWHQDYCEVSILPLKPFWFKRRPVIIKLHRTPNTIVIESEIICAPSLH